MKVQVRSIKPFEHSTQVMKADFDWSTVMTKVLTQYLRSKREYDWIITNDVSVFIYEIGKLHKFDSNEHIAHILARDIETVDDLVYLTHHELYDIGFDSAQRSKVRKYLQQRHEKKFGPGTKLPGQ